MNKSVKYYFDLAIKVASSKEDRRSFKIGTVAQRRDGVLVCASNSATYFPEPRAHSENRVAKKLDFGAILYVVRILRLDGSPALSRPCGDCQRVLRSRKVSKVYYSISPREYGVWYPASGKETYHLIQN
jgi:hypothetical protein